MPIDSRPRSRRMRVPLLVAALGIALGVGGIALLRPLEASAPPRLAATAARVPTATRPLTNADIRSRVEPSIVDVTATLTYDDETASGTGFVIDSASQLIITNNHVIRDATAVTITLPATGRAYPARIVGVDVTADIAVLRIVATPRLPGAPLGNSADVSAGLPVISFGNQAGAGGAPTVAAGVISATGRTVQASDGASGFSETLRGMLATTARIAPGDSGGPLASTAGTVIGVDTAAGTGGTATGYAIPINTALAAERQITAGRRDEGITLGTAGFLGVVIVPGDLRSPEAQAAKVKQRNTVMTAAGSAKRATAAGLAGTAGPAATAGTTATAGTAKRAGSSVGAGTAGRAGAADKADGADKAGTADGAHPAAAKSDLAVPQACVPSLASVRAPARVARVAAGALVDGVLCGTGAAAAGIAAGDVITAAGGRRVVSPAGLTALIGARRPGTVISVTWVTSTGTPRTAPVRVSAAPAV